jgi:hypothetical protein
MGFTKTPENDSYLFSQKILADQVQQIRETNKHDAEQEAALRRMRIEELKSKGLSLADAEMEVDRGKRVIDYAERQISYHRSSLIDKSVFAQAPRVMVNPATGKAQVVRHSAPETEKGKTIICINDIDQEKQSRQKYKDVILYLKRQPRHFQHKSPTIRAWIRGGKEAGVYQLRNGDGTISKKYLIVENRTWKSITFRDAK